MQIANENKENHQVVDNNSTYLQILRTNIVKLYSKQLRESKS